MRWTRWPTLAAFALLLGFATAALASGPTPTVTRHCPKGYRLHRTRVRAWVCTKLPTVRTVTVDKTTTVASPAVTTSDTVTAAGLVTTLPGVTQPATTDTITIPPVTTTLPAVTDVSTETQTVTGPATTVTDTITDTVGASASASLAWCGGHGGNWSDPNCDAPPNPLVVPSGGSVTLAASTTGSLVDEPFPQGYLTYTVTGPAGAVWSESDQSYGLNPDASQNCSRVENFSGQAEGSCVYTFGTRGQYIVSVGFVDTDGNYGYPAPITTTLNVG